MSRTIRVHEHGGPEVLRLEDLDVPDPGPGQVRVQQRAIGLNFIDTYHRSGLYPVQLPTGIGMEAAGVVESVGDGVSDLKPGMRVAYAGGPPGAYAELRNVSADKLVPLPEALDDETAAAIMLKGMTIEYLIRRTVPVQAGDTVLFHAAAGGVGLIACQWLAHLGATVIGTVGSDDKAQLAAAHGCHHPIVYTKEDFVQRVRELTDGKGVRVVYDSVGKDTVHRSLDCLRRRGTLVAFGNASGPPDPLNLLDLSRKGSLFVTRPTLFDYVATRDELLASAGALFDVVGSGAVKVQIGQRFGLHKAEQAHRALEQRRTTGSTLLLP